MIKVGDRVKAKTGTFCGAQVADNGKDTGTVIIVKPLEEKFLIKGILPEIGVQWDHKLPYGEGHSCAGWVNGAVFKNGHCRWGNAGELVVVGSVEEIMPECWIVNGKTVYGMTPVKEDD